MLYGIAIEEKKGFWVPLMHNIATKQLAVDLVQMEFPKGSGRPKAAIFDHTLDHPGEYASQCPACVAAIQERFDILKERDNERVAPSAPSGQEGTSPMANPAGNIPPVQKP